MQGPDELLASNGTNLETFGARFGLGTEHTRVAIASRVPAVMGGFQKAGAEEITPVGLEKPEVETGNTILGQIFGTTDISRTVADHAARQSGVSSTILKAMLPIIAAMVAKHFAGRADAGGSEGLGGMLGSILGGGSGGLGGLFGGRAGNRLDQILGRLR